MKARFRPTLAALLVAAPIAAQAPATWESAAPLTADPVLLLQAGAQRPPKDGVPVVEFLEESLIQIDEAGRKEIRYRYVFRVDQDSAVESWGSVSAMWSPWFEHRPEIQARVVTPDGRSHLLDPKTLGEYGADDQGADVFGDQKHLRGPLPKLTKGAVAEVVIRYREKVPFSRSGVMGRIGLAEGTPLLHTRVELRAPGTAPLRVKVQGLAGVQPVQSLQEGQSRTVLDLGPREAFEVGEPHRASEEARGPAFAFSTVKSWADLAVEYAGTVAAKTQGVNVAAWVAQATEGATTQEARVASIVARLHRDVRYTGIEFGDSAIVPTPPAETLRRGYGDCKDKATLLVCLLRAAGIPAEVALLRAGTDPDVDPEVPGMALFNHAIVKVLGPQPLWIDATVELARPGELLTGVEGRLALVAVPGVAGLERIPELTPELNRQEEVRKVRLADFGPGSLVEMTQAWGMFEYRYRRDHLAGDEKKIREDLLTYAKDGFSAKGLGGIHHTEARDLTAPFSLEIEIQDAAAASVDFSQAAVNVNPWSLVSRLSRDLKGEAQEGEDKPRLGDLVLPEPYAQELTYVIPPAAGFKADVLPRDREVRFGLASLRMTYAVAGDGTVTAHYRFHTGPRRWKAAEVNEARKALKTFGEEKIPMVIFNQVGEAHLAAGHIKEAIREFRQLALQAPGKARPHIRIARAYLAAGLGEAARDEARKAVQLEPESAQAQQTLGWVLQHDLAGRRFAKGWDQLGALECYRRGKQLDPKIYAIRGDLAILLEYNQEGVRYGTGADLAGSVRECQAIRTDLKVHDLDRNLVLNLGKLGRYQECVDLARTLEPSQLRDTWLVVSLVHLQGLEGALAEATRVLTDAKGRREALVNAADVLLRERRYPEAVRLLQEGANGSEQMSQLRARAELLNRVQKVEVDSRMPRDPADLVRQFLSVLLRQPEDTSRMRQFMGPGILDSVGKAFGKSLQQGVQGSLRNVDLPPAVAADVGLSLAQIASEGSDEKGHRVTLRNLDNGKITFYVRATDKGYRIVGTSDATEWLGLESLWLVDHGRADEARIWLDQARLLIASPPADDALAGPQFARFWVKGQAATDADIRRAATVLVMFEEDLPRVPGLLAEASKGSRDPMDRDRVDLCRVYAANTRKDWATSLALTEDLAKRYPQSLTVLRARVRCLLMARHWEEALQFADRQSDSYPDEVLFRQARFEALKRLGKRELMERELASFIQRGGAQPTDHNNLAWSQVVRGVASEQSLEHARAATQGNASSNTAALHTLASVLGELGRTAEARDALVKEMDLQRLDHLGANEWYVLGRIAGHLDVPDVALGCYDRAFALKIADDPADEESCAMLSARCAAELRAKRGRTS